MKKACGGFGEAGRTEQRKKEWIKGEQREADTSREEKNPAVRSALEGTKRWGKCTRWRRKDCRKSNGDGQAEVGHEWRDRDGKRSRMEEEEEQMGESQRGSLVTLHTCGRHFCRNLHTHRKGCKKGIFFISTGLKELAWEQCWSCLMLRTSRITSRDHRPNGATWDTWIRNICWKTTLHTSDFSSD